MLTQSTHTNATAENIDKEKKIDISGAEDQIQKYEPLLLNGTLKRLELMFLVSSLLEKVRYTLKHGQFNALFSIHLKTLETNYLIRDLIAKGADVEDFTDVWFERYDEFKQDLYTKTQAAFTEIYRSFWNICDQPDATTLSEYKTLETQVVNAYQHQLSELEKHRYTARQKHKAIPFLRANTHMITTIVQLRPFEKIDEESQKILTTCLELLANIIQIPVPKRTGLLATMNTATFEFDVLKAAIFNQTIACLATTYPFNDLEHILFSVKCIESLCEYSSQSDMNLLALTTVLFRTKQLISTLENCDASQIKIYPYLPDILARLKPKSLALYRRCDEIYHQLLKIYIASKNNAVNQTAESAAEEHEEFTRETEIYLNLLLMGRHEISLKPNENIEEQVFINNTIVGILNDRDIPKSIAPEFSERICKKSLQILAAINNQQNSSAAVVAVTEIKDDKTATISELNTQITELKQQLDEKKDAIYDDYIQWADAALHRLYLATQMTEDKLLTDSLQEIKVAIAYAEKRMFFPTIGKVVDHSKPIAPNSENYTERTITLTLYLADVYKKQNKFLKSFNYYHKAIKTIYKLNEFVSLETKGQPCDTKPEELDLLLYQHLSFVYLQYINNLKAKIRKILATKSMTEKVSVLVKKYENAIKLAKIIPAEMINMTYIHSEYKVIIGEINYHLAKQTARAIADQNIGHLEKIIANVQAEAKSNPDKEIENHFSVYENTLEKTILNSCHHLLVQLYIFLLLRDQKDSKWQVAGFVVNVLEKSDLFTLQDGKFSLNNYTLDDFKGLLNKIINKPIHLNAQVKTESDLLKIIAAHQAVKAHNEVDITNKLITNLVAKFKPFIPADDKNAPGYSASDTIEQLTKLAHHSVATLKCSWTEKKSIVAKVHLLSFPKLELAANVPQELLRDTFFLIAKEMIITAQNDKAAKITAEKDRITKERRNKDLQRLDRKKQKTALQAEEKETKAADSVNHTKEVIAHLHKIKISFDTFIHQNLNDVDAYFDCQIDENARNITISIATHTAAFHAHRLRILKEEFLNKIIEHCFYKDIYSIDRIKNQYAFSIKVIDLANAKQVGFDRRFLQALKSLLDDTTAKHMKAEKEAAAKIKLGTEKNVAVKPQVVKEPVEEKTPPILGSAALGMFSPRAAILTTQAATVKHNDEKSTAVVQANPAPSISNVEMLAQRLAHNFMFSKLIANPDSETNLRSSSEYRYF